MTRIALTLLLLALASPSWAQSLSVADGLRYVAGVEELRADIEWHPQGAARALFKANHLKITALFRRAGPGQPPLLRYAKIEAPSGPRLMIPGKNRELRSLVVRENGDLIAQLNGVMSFDVPVRLTSAGGLVLDMPLWLKDDHFTAEELGGPLTRWPPSLEDLLRIVTSPGQGPMAFSFQGPLSWRVEGRAAPFAFPLPIGQIEAASRLSLSGQGEVRANGELRSPVGTQNRVVVSADLRRATLRNRAGQVTLHGGEVRYQGSYGLRAGGGRASLALDGHLSYDLNLGSVDAQALSGRLRAQGGTLRGQGPLRGTIDAQGGSVQADVDAGGGTFALEVVGPVTAQGVQAGQAQLDLSGRGTLSAQGRVAEATTARLGLEDVILGTSFVPDAGSTATVAGTTLALNADDRLELTARGAGQVGPNGVRIDGSGSLNGRGTLEARTAAGEAALEADLQLTGTVRTEQGLPQFEASGPLLASFHAQDAELPRDDGRVHVGSLDGTLQLDVALSGAGVRATGHVDATARDLVYEQAAPSAPATAPVNAPVTEPAPAPAPIAEPVTQPAPAPAPIAGNETVTVVSGDTLWALAQRFDTSVQALRDANGLGPHHVLQVGEVLEIPGTAAPVVNVAVEPTEPTPAAPETPAPAVAEAPATSQPAPALAPGYRLGVDQADVSLDLTEASWSPQAGLQLAGTLSGGVVVSTAELADHRLEAKLVGAAELQLSPAQLAVSRSPTGQLQLQGPEGLAVPLTIRLDAGTWVRIPGQVEGRLDRPGSLVRCTAWIVPGADGALRLDRLEDVEATVKAGGMQAGSATLPSGAVLSLRGRAQLRPDGLDLFGVASVTTESQGGAPILSLSW